MALQESLDWLMGGCAARGWMIDDGICELLMQELDLLELELREPSGLSSRPSRCFSSWVFSEP
jgi:hypothetical protein